MRLLLAVAILSVLLFVPAQEATTSIEVLSGLTISDTSVTVGEEVILSVFVNVTVLFNDTIAEAWNGTISVNVTMKIPDGLNYTRSSEGEYANGTFEAFWDNTTYAVVYLKLKAVEEGNYTLSATITVNASITARSGNETPAYYNDTQTFTTNMVRLSVYEEQTTTEERNRISVYDALRSRYLQILLGLMLLGFLLSNFISDRRAKRQRS